jgi:hypothetical protein
MEIIMNRQIKGNLINDSMVQQSLAVYSIKNAQRIIGPTDDKLIAGNLYKGDNLIAKFAEETMGGYLVVDIVDENLHNEFIKLVNTFPSINSCGIVYHATRDIVISEMILHELKLKSWKDKCKQNILFIDSNTPDGSYNEWNVPYSEEAVQSLTNMLNSKGVALIEVINKRFM